MALKWGFVIDGRNNYLRNLHYDLTYDDLIIYDEGEEETGLTYYFSSVHLNHFEVDDADEIYSKALQMVTIINGIDILIQENKQKHFPIKLSQLIDNTNDSWIKYNSNQSVNIINVDFTINKTVNHKKSHYIKDIFEVAKKDDFVMNIFLIISKGLNYQTAYSVLDAIKTFLKKNSDSLKDLGINQTELQLFNHTANNYQAVGTLARHGDKGQQPPANPMSLEKAQEFISNIVKIVIEKYYGLKLPVRKEMKIDVTTLFEEE